MRPDGARLPDFALTTQDGEPVTAACLRGRPVVVTFVYSTCKDTCPAQVQSIRGALDDLGHDVPVVGVSVDPANDTPGAGARVPARAVDDRPDGLPARHPRAARAGVEGVRDRPAAQGPRPLRLHRARRRRRAPAHRVPRLAAHVERASRPTSCSCSDLRGPLLRGHLAALPEGGDRGVRARPRGRAPPHPPGRAARLGQDAARRRAGAADRPARARAHAQQRGPGAVAARRAPVRLGGRRRAHRRARSRASRSPA